MTLAGTKKVAVGSCLNGNSDRLEPGWNLGLGVMPTDEDGERIVLTSGSGSTDMRRLKEASASHSNDEGVELLYDSENERRL